MNPNFLLVLLLVVQTVSSMPRNPFQPLLSPCDALFNQLAQWTLHGVISSDKGAVSVMRDAQKNWRRITRGMEIAPGVRVLEISQRRLSVTVPAACGQPFYSWKIEGKKYGMDAYVLSADSLAIGKPRG
ncbi:HofP DNA utilization family protein [Dryocola sp. BD613]|uniref:HofP DNA utilization family protein n=1 Tax=Dryocola sp. BD613 TaxID=3133272 RepID=UPI003F4F421F